MHEFITVEHARQQILQQLDPVGAERVFLSQAVGRVLAENVTAPADSPRFDNSARDGYAVRFDDLDGKSPTTLRLEGSIAAGQPEAGEVAAGAAARIMTGAPVPDGADTVVMQEYCEVDEDAATVTVARRPDAGRAAWVRHAGMNMARGETVLSAGDRMGPAEVGLLAGFGRSVLAVTRRPRVAIVSTGDELVEPDRRPGPNQIINSNAYLLEALVAEAGGHPVAAPVVPDEKPRIRQTFASALADADIVLSSGGVSVGDFDVTRQVLEELTGSMNFWKVRMKPGKPLAFGTANAAGKPVALVGLPGNPNSCFVGFHQFVRPALAVLQGADPADTARRRLDARLGSAIDTTPRRRTYLSGRLQWDSTDSPTFIAADRQNSANLALFCQADAFGVIPEGVAHLEAGDDITVEFID